MQKYIIDPVTASFYFTMVDYRGDENGSPNPTHRDEYPSPKEAHDKYRGPSGILPEIRCLEDPTTYLKGIP